MGHLCCWWLGNVCLVGDWDLKAAETPFLQELCLAAMDFCAAIGKPCSTKRRRCSTSRRLFLTNSKRRTAKGEILWANGRTMLESTLEMLCRCFGLVSVETVDVGVKGCLCLLMECCCLKMCYTCQKWPCSH